MKMNKCKNKLNVYKMEKASNSFFHFSVNNFHKTLTFDKKNYKILCVEKYI